MGKRPTDRQHLGNSFSPDLLGRRDLSIFNIDLHWRRDWQPLPSILVTEPTIESRVLEDSDELYTVPHGGRFPLLRFPDESSGPLGGAARAFANSYYMEGLNTPAKENRGKRIDCFRAAELLFLHAIARGDLKSHVGLGQIYVHDRCEGHYFDALNNNLLADFTLPEDIIAQKAYDHFSYAAAKGDIEGAYLLGDMLREGHGCPVDLTGAFECYCHANDLLSERQSPHPILRGNIALRLGRAFERAEGCVTDYEAALRWYEVAFEALGDTVNSGMLYFHAEYGQAMRGVSRMRQELAFSSWRKADNGDEQQTTGT